jgi:hypothetical protein
MQPLMMIARDFYCHPYMLPTIFIKIKISLAKFALAKINKLHNFPSHFWRICKVCNSFFYMVENCATFQKTKKSPALKKKKKFQMFLQPPIFIIDPQFGDFAKIQNRG